MDKLAEYASDNVALRMLLQLDPTGIGSALDVYLMDIFDTYKKRRARDFFTKIATGNVIITKEMIDSDDFLFAFFSTTNSVLTTNKKEKIDLFANLFIHGVTTGEYNSTKYEQYLSIVDEITFLELQILEILYRYERENEDLKVGLASDGPISNILQKADTFWSKFEDDVEQIYKIQPDILQGMLTRLNRTGLYETIVGSFFDYTGGRGYTTSLYNDFRQWVIGNKSENSQ